ncbi:hypothetical protein AB4K20DRAFT_1361059 [Rhizopus microsporus]
MVYHIYPCGYFIIIINSRLLMIFWCLICCTHFVIKSSFGTTKANHYQILISCKRKPGDKMSITYIFFFFFNCRALDYIFLFCEEYERKRSCFHVRTA